MGSLNKAMIIGRLGQDPEVRYTQNNTAVATLNVATSERYKDQSGEWKESTEWHRVVAWGRLAEVCNQYAKKGREIYVEGPITTREWEDRDGNKRYTTEIKALTVQFLGSRSDGSGGNSGSNSDGGYSSNTSPAASRKTASAANESSTPFSDDVDDDLPF